VNKQENKYILSSVKNTLKVLNSFTKDQPEWGIRELAKHLQLTHSTIQRIMVTLASEGYVTQDINSRKYRLGVRLLAFQNVITSHLEIHEESYPHLQELVKNTGETAHISILEGAQLVYLHKVEPARPIRVFTEIGARVPCYCVAGGKVILAYQSEQKIQEVIDEGLHPFTEKTVTDPDMLRKQLREITEKGYTTTQGELLVEGEVLSIAAPIYNYFGTVFASVSLVCIGQRITDDMKLKYIERVKKTASKISKDLGYYEQNS